MDLMKEFKINLKNSESYGTRVDKQKCTTKPTIQNIENRFYYKIVRS